MSETADQPAADPSPADDSAERFARFAETLTAQRRAAYSALAQQAERATQRAAEFSRAFRRALLSELPIPSVEAQQEPAGSAP